MCPDRDIFQLQAQRSPDTRALFFCPEVWSPGSGHYLLTSGTMCCDGDMRVYFAGQSRCDPYSWSFHFMIPEFGGRLLMMTRVELITNFHSRVVS